MKTRKILGTLFIIWGVVGWVHYEYQRPTPLRLALEYIQTSAQATCYPLPDSKNLAAAPTEMAGELVIFRKLTAADEPVHRAILSNPALNQLFFMDSHGHLPTANPTYYIYQQLVWQAVGKSVSYSIFDKKTGKIGGAMQIFVPNASPVGAISGYANLEYWGKGHSDESIAIAHKIFRKCFTHAPFTARTTRWNRRCQAFLVKNGFRLCTDYQAPEQEESKNLCFFIRQESCT